jgi:MFS family permease
MISGSQGEDAMGATPTLKSSRGALRDRNFFPYFVGNLLSSSGTWFHNIAQTLLVYRLTGSLFLVGLVNMAQFIGVFLLGASAGVVADRYDRRKVLLATQVVSAAISALLAICVALDYSSVAIVMVAALALGIAQTYSTPAMLAMVPQLVSPENLGPAVAINIVALNVARAVGPVIGAFIVSRFGIAAAFGLNSLSFLVFAVSLLVIKTRASGIKTIGLKIRIMDTARSLKTRPQIGVLFVVGTCASMAIDPVTTLTPGFATEVFHRSDTVVGWLVGSFGLGAVTAGIWISRLPIASYALLSKRMVLLNLSLLVFGFSSSFYLSVIALFFAGFAFISTSAAALTRVQVFSNADEHGRLMALWGMAFMGSRPVASLIDGAVATATNVHIATLLMIAPAILGTILLNKSARKTI